MPGNSRITWRPSGGDEEPREPSRPIAEWAPPPPRSSRPTPTLNQIGRDLTRLAREGKLAKHFGRERELMLLQQILLRKTKNNPILIGLPGVGKTALVEGFAQRIVQGSVPPALRGLRIVEIAVSALTANTVYRGTFESRVREIIDEATASRDIVLFIDEIHTLVGAGVIEGGRLDAANILKPALARGDLRCIGATTHDEFNRYFRADSALERRFEPVRIEPPSVTEAIEILTAARPEFEAHHQVQIAPSAITAAVTLSERYLLDRYLPDKAFDLLDHACARVRLHQRSESLAGSPRETVDDTAIAETLAERLGVPIVKVGEDIGGRLAQLEGFLKEKVIGQGEAVQRIAVALRQAYSGLRDPNRPRYIFAFFGPTGVGKTLTAKALAEFIFGSPDTLIRLDMSELKEGHTISRLWGAPPGYIGYGDEGTFASRLRRQPFAVVLLDEFEKAHPQVHDAFLQIFDEGRFSDARGRIVDARHALFILTSNLFADSLSDQTLDASSIADGLRHQLSTILRPELVNRIDELIWFHPLDVADLARIVESQIRLLNDRLRKDGLEIVTTPEAVFWIANRVTDPQNGARAAVRAVTHYVTEPIATALAEKRLVSVSKLALRVRDGGLIIDYRVDRTDAG